MPPSSRLFPPSNLGDLPCAAGGASRASCRVWCRRGGEGGASPRCWGRPLQQRARNAAFLFTEPRAGRSSCKNDTKENLPADSKSGAFIAFFVQTCEKNTNPPLSNFCNYITNKNRCAGEFSLWAMTPYLYWQMKKTAQLKLFGRPWIRVIHAFQNMLKLLNMTLQ